MPAFVTRNSPGFPASNTMSSLSGAQYEADLPRPAGGSSSEPASGGAGAHVPAASDIDLIRRARAGDRAAYGQLVIRYQHRLFNAVLRMVGDREEARELTQEAFTRGLEKL